MWRNSSCTHISYTNNTSPSPTIIHQKSHLPSFHPVRHLSSHLLQSNVSLPSFTLTALCASHIHVPNSPLLLTLGVFFVIQSWKSSAHTQQGYSLPNVERKPFVSVCNSGVGFTGYVAVIECKRVHEERPRASTSGGQSVGRVGAAAAAVDFGFLPAMAKSEATSLQVRHLRVIKVSAILHCLQLPHNCTWELTACPGALLARGTYGLPSGPSTMPLDSLFGATRSASCFSGVSIDPGAISACQSASVVVMDCCAEVVVISKRPLRVSSVQGLVAQGHPCFHACANRGDSVPPFTAFCYFQIALGTVV